MASPAIEQPADPGTRLAPTWLSSVRRGSPWAILPAVLLFYAVLMPLEVRFTIAEQNLYPTRIVGIALVPWMIWTIAHNPITFRFWDYLFFFAAFWIVFAFMAFYGPTVGLRRGTILAFDTVVPYLTGRLFLRTPTDLRRFLVIISPGLLVAGATLLFEVMMARPLIRPGAAAIFGNVSAYEGGVAIGVRESIIDTRLGILRATGPFSHPILAGLLLACFLPIYFMSGLRKWPLFIGVGASFFAVLSASSAAILALLLGAVLIAIDRAHQLYEFVNWRVIIPVTSVLLVLLNFMTESGLITYLTRFTLDPRTASFRRITWEYGMRSVEKHPWFGIGFTEYERPIWMLTSSVDNHWLLLAMRYGIVPAIAIFAVSIAAIVILATSAARRNEADRRLQAGLASAVLIVTLLGFSVAFFGGALYWFYMLFAIGISIGSMPEPVRHYVIPGNSPLALGHSLPDQGTEMPPATGKPA